MTIRSTYSIEKTFVCDQYIEFELSFDDISKASFSFVYRKSGASTWEENAVIEILQAGYVSGNVVDRAVLVNGKCNLKWYYPLNGVEYRDSVNISINPFFHSSMFVNLEDKTAEVDIGVSGIGDIAFLSDKRFGEDYYLSGDDLYYNGTLIFSNIPGSYITSFTISATRRFLIADSLGDRLVEVDSSGVIISQCSGYAPSYCEYNETNGNVLIISSSDNDAKEIYWKNGVNPHPNLGTEIWSYNTDFPVYPLTDPKSATYGVGNNIIISDTSVIKIDRDLSSRTEYSYFEFKKKAGTNYYYPYSMRASFEISEDNLFSSESLGEVLPYSPTSTTHITYNRSLRDDSSINTPRAFENSLFYPVKPIISSDDEVNITIDTINSAYLLKKTNDAYVSDGSRVPVLESIAEERARGDVISDRAFWGVAEAYNRGIGTQTIACMTGQTLSVKIPYYDTKIGYKKITSSIDPVYVRETVSLDFVDVFSGTATTYLLPTVLSEDTKFVIQIPEASALSYQRCSSNGFHGHYMIKITVTEDYFDSNNFEVQSIDSKTYYSYVSVFSYWWRQIFKEIVIPDSPITSDFDLFNYSQSIATFFDSYTCYPTFYKIVGTTTLTITDAQKEKIILENAFALFSYYSGMSPGDSPLAITFGLGAAYYQAEESFISTNIHRIDLENRTIDSRLPGLNAVYQGVNIFNNYPATACTSNQHTRDLFPVMFSKEEILKADWMEGGMFTIPICGQLVSEEVYTLDGSETLSFSIDEPDISISSITLKGKYNNSDAIVPGDTKLTVSFTSSSVDIQEVTMGVSVDGSPFVVYSDPSGALRQFCFTAPAPILNTSVIDGFVELTDSNQNKFVYNVTRRISEEQRISSINNVEIAIDRGGKLLQITYDLNGKYKIVPYTVALFMEIEGEYFDQSNICGGDIGNVFSGYSKLITMNYEEAIADEDLQRGIIRLRIVLTPVIASETASQYDYSVSFRSPDIWENKIEQEMAIFVSKQEEEFYPKKIVSADKIYTVRNWDVGSFEFETARVAITFSSSSSFSSSDSSSSSYTF